MAPAYSDNPDDPRNDEAADFEVHLARAKSESVLDLSFRGLHRLPLGTGGVSNLLVLDLRSNQITTIPQTVAGSSEPGPAQGSGAVVVAGAGLLPRGLQVLRLSSNLVEELGEPLLAGLDALETLEVDSNRLKRLPANLLACTSLTTLSLHRNQLDALPRALGERLQRLKYLDVSYNGLRTLPDSLGQLESLEHVNAKFNKLERIPASLGNAKNLRHLDLSSNFIDLKTIPGSLGFLSNLTFLDLSNNGITHLPVQLGKLKSIEILSLEGNPLQFPPHDLLSITVPRDEATGGGGKASHADASEAALKATTAVVMSFLQEKLKEWEASEGSNRTNGAWEGWLGDWHLWEWLSSLFSATPAVPALQGVSVSAVPRAVLPAAAAAEKEVSAAVQNIALAVTRSNSVKQAPVTPETQALVGRRAVVPEESLTVSQRPAHVSVPLIQREDVQVERKREACLA